MVSRLQEKENELEYMSAGREKAGNRGVLSAGARSDALAHTPF